ncbi:hypothetical protein [Alphaentomopoxvirus acuprea]|uniref:Uncharacterized protein n=1 Tax=Alphaentomopoxvirus acuprea TaxID=62099 RepID=W6JKT7_9POXV|nr:hypothetical protein BA82_gp035 [Anomala cuprea entomopoxvirus]BAO49395.1 hypothetical protein [Anomala cuprea entomopoxvirus]
MDTESFDNILSNIDKLENINNDDIKNTILQLINYHNNTNFRSSIELIINFINSYAIELDLYNAEIKNNNNVFLHKYFNDDIY